MPRSARTANGLTSSDRESQSHYTLTSRFSTKATLALKRSMTHVTAVTEEATMDHATSTSSPLSSIPSSLVSSATSNEPRSPFTTKHEQVVSNGDDDKTVLTSKDASRRARSAVALAAGEDEAVSQSGKRALEENDAQIDTQPNLKKLATEEDVRAAQLVSQEDKALDEATGVDDDAFASADEDVEPKKSARKSKPKPKAVTKKKPVATVRRTPACAECKRRKVKCRHNQDEEGIVGKGNAQINPKPVAADMESSETEPVAQGDDHNAHVGKPSKKSKSKKKPTPQPTKTPPERASARSRKAPERFEDLQEQPPARSPPARKSTSRVFDPTYITTNSTSRLGRADIYHMLLEDEAWTSLSPSQQATLISMLPDSTENQRLLARIGAGETGKDTRPQWLMASNVFRDEVAKFKDDLTNGHLAKTWQAAAKQAVVERAAGEYDAWKAEEAEAWWGQKGT